MSSINADTYKKSATSMMLARVAIMILSIITHIINVRYLEPNVYGIFALSMTVISILSTPEGSISSSISRYLPLYVTYKNYDNVYAIYHTARNIFNMLLCANVFILLLLRITGMLNELNFSQCAILFGIALGIVYNGFWGTVLISFKQMRFFSITELICALSYCACVLIFSQIFEYSLFSSLLAVLFPIVLKNVIFYSKIRQIFHCNPLYTSKRLYKSLIIYSLLIGFSMIFKAIITSSGMLLLKASYETPEILGYFGVISALGIRGRTVMSSLWKSAGPYVTTWHAEKRFHLLKNFLTKFVIAILALCCVLTLLLNNFGELLVKVVYGTKYIGVSDYLIVSCCAYLIFCLSEIFSLFLNCMGYPKICVKLYFVSLMVYIISLYIIQLYTTLPYAILSAILVSSTAFCVLATSIAFELLSERNIPE